MGPSWSLSAGAASSPSVAWPRNLRAERIANRMPVAIKVLLSRSGGPVVRLWSGEGAGLALASEPRARTEIGSHRRHYIALELVDGAVARRSAPQRRLAAPLAAPHVVAEVGARARLTWSPRERTCVHRDVTPRTSCARGRARCGSVTSESHGPHSPVGARAPASSGKLAYLARGRVTSGQVDARSDLYAAAGLVLFEAVAGGPLPARRYRARALREAEAPTFHSSGNALMAIWSARCSQSHPRWGTERARARRERMGAASDRTQRVSSRERARARR